MPTRFALASDSYVRESPHNAVKYLWAAGSNSLAAVGLTQRGSAYVVPEDATLLMLGFTAELEAEITATDSAGINRFISPPDGHEEAWRMSSLAARKRTVDGGDDIGVPIVVTVVAVQGADVRFGDEWSSFGLAVPPLRMSLILQELPGFRELKTR
jgi:hypothetical protein